MSWEADPLERVRRGELFRRPAPVIREHLPATAPRGLAVGDVVRDARFSDLIYRVAAIAPEGVVLAGVSSPYSLRLVARAFAHADGAPIVLRGVS